MVNSKLYVRVFGIIYILLGLWTIASFLIEYFTGALAYDVIVPAESRDVLTEQIYNSMLIGMGVGIGLVALVQMFVGIRGIAQANGNTKAKAHRGWLIVFIVFGVLGLIGTISSIAQVSGSWVQLITSLLTLAISIGFYITSKKLAQEQGTIPR